MAASVPGNAYCAACGRSEVPSDVFNECRGTLRCKGEREAEPKKEETR